MRYAVAELLKRRGKVDLVEQLCAMIWAVLSEDASVSMIAFSFVCIRGREDS